MYNRKKIEKIKNDPTKHYPNSNESKELRKIMSKNKLTKEEVLSHKKFRIELSNAQNKKGDKTYEERRYLDLLKSCTKELKLPKEHPLIKELLFEKIDKSWGYNSALKHMWMSNYGLK